MNFADKVIQFNRKLHYTGEKLPGNIVVLNPFVSGDALRISETFYRKYYNDTNRRHLILGINPGRFGAGLTGVPFTDPKRLVSECGIPYNGKLTHEPSSVFIYEMIHAYGGPEKFYGDFYINSPCPLGFVSVNAKGAETNYNYYDSRQLLDATHDFIVSNIEAHIRTGVSTDVCFCLGTGKNKAFLEKLNNEKQFFKKLIALEHPRYIMQYKSADKDFYINKYVEAFRLICDL